MWHDYINIYFVQWDPIKQTTHSHTQSYSSNYQFDITDNNNTTCKKLKGVVLLILFDS